MYSRRTVDVALVLSAIGVLDSENAQILGVSIGAIRHWRCGRRRRGAASDDPARAPIRLCPRCDGLAVDEGTYAYLLGLYLGDGYLTAGRRGVYGLSLMCGNDWPGLIDAAQAAMSRVVPTSKVFRVPRPGCTEVKSWSKHWACLFPQHSSGRKHSRVIALEPWQQTIVAAFPGEFARGLFHSDGCRVTNQVTRKLPAGEKHYSYPRYFFSNESADILRLCGDVPDLLGVAWRYSRRNAISVARRDAVARLDEFVGPKY